MGETSRSGPPTRTTTTGTCSRPRIRYALQGSTIHSHRDENQLTSFACVSDPLPDCFRTTLLKGNELYDELVKVLMEVLLHVGEPDNPGALGSILTFVGVSEAQGRGAALINSCVYFTDQCLRFGAGCTSSGFCSETKKPCRTAVSDAVVPSACAKQFIEAAREHCICTPTAGENLRRTTSRGMPTTTQR